MPCITFACKIYKFREMAFQSNIMLSRKKLSNGKPSSKKPSEFKNLNLNLQLPSSELVNDENIVYSVKESAGDDMNDVEYEFTVIVASDEQGDGIECETLDKSTISEEMVVIQEDEYVATEDEETSTSLEPIPKISLPKHRGRKATSDCESRSSTCHICGKTLSNHSSYKYHMQLHSDHTPFLCNECGEGFRTRNAYEGHMVTHLKSNPNKCEICGKSYRQGSIIFLLIFMRLNPNFYQN